MASQLSQNQVPFHGDLDIISLFIHGPTLDRWQFQTLPSYELSGENGVIYPNEPTYHY
jgi:hypothetical protein